MMYPEYSNATTCGGSYCLFGKVCTWEVTTENGLAIARIYGDDRYEGKAYPFTGRRYALMGLADLIFAEVA